MERQSPSWLPDEDPGPQPPHYDDDLTLDHDPQRSTNPSTSSQHDSYPHFPSQSQRALQKSPALRDSGARRSSLHSVMPDDAHYEDVPRSVELLKSTKPSTSPQQSRQERDAASDSSSSSQGSVHSALDADTHDSKRRLFVPDGHSDGHRSKDTPAFSTSSTSISTATKTDQSPPRPRRTRALMTRLQGDSLTKLWNQTMFPSTNEREALAQRIGLSARQVQVWFQNQRQKRRRERESDGMISTEPGVHGDMGHRRRHSGQYEGEDIWQRNQPLDGYLPRPRPRWPPPRDMEMRTGTVAGVTSTRISQDFTLSSAASSSSDLASRFHRQYASSTSSNPSSMLQAEQAYADYARPGTDDSNALHFYGGARRDQRDEYELTRRQPQPVGRSYYSGSSRHPYSRTDAWPYTWQGTSPRSGPTRPAQDDRETRKPSFPGRSLTYDDGQSYGRSSASHANPGPYARSAPAGHSMPTTSPRATHLPPSLAGLVLDGSVDGNEESAAVLSPINMAAAKLQPELPVVDTHQEQPTPDGHQGPDGNADSEHSSSKRPPSAAPSSLARLLN